MKAVRCAIYTRKSSDEGLEQGFNSLDAQYEACAAYILSQASEGWVALPDRYDDGGISGGTLERPALQRLLAEVRAGRIDTIVVYKVDRLSRSLFDFAKLVETFDKVGTSFVSITQSFNTTTSMGRLTLNMLLSFAQFEREVTAERIRDKIAASKAKGMWMGGNAPIGYAPNGRSLAIVEVDANLVRDIFKRYLELGNVPRLEEQLLREGIFSPSRRTITGKSMGGVPFIRTQIYKILSNPLYLGLIPHRGKTYPGLHPAIIEQPLWDAVQAKLAANLQGKRRGGEGGRSALLTGRIVDEAGKPLIPAHSSKPTREGEGGRVRYSYYVSASRQRGNLNEGWRVPARELDALVGMKLAELLDDALILLDRASLNVPTHDLIAFEQRVAVVAARIRAKDYALVRDLVGEIRLRSASVEIDVSAPAIAAAAGASLDDTAPVKITLTVQARLTRSGIAMRLIQGGKSAAAEPDRPLIRLIVRARGYWSELRKGQLNVGELAEQEGVGAPYITRVLRLAYLSPATVEAILAGRQPAALTARALVQTDAIDSDWRQQEERLLPPVPADNISNRVSKPAATQNPA